MRERGDVRFRVRVSMEPTLAQLAQRLQAATGEILDLTPIWPEVASTLAAAVRANFDSQGASLGARWREQDPEYKRRKHGGAVGVATGAMREAVRALPTIRSTEKSVTVGLLGNPLASRAAWFHFGGGARRGAAPARFFFEPSRAQEAVVVGLIRRFIEAKIAASQGAAL